MDSEKGINPIAIIIVIAVVLVIGGLYVYSQKVKQEDVVPDKMMEDDAAMMTGGLSANLVGLNNFNQTGTAVLSDMNGQAKVVINTAGYDSPVAQPIHIHAGSCSQLGAVVYALSELKDGSSETLLNVSMDELLSKLPLAINGHKSADEAQIYTTCGDLSVIPGSAGMDKSDSAMMMEKMMMDEMMKEVDDAMMAEMKAMDFDFSGELFDVTDGNDVRGINTDGKASGTAMAIFKDGVYSMMGSFHNLPDPQGSDFYEGWIVRKGNNFSVISTGRLVKSNGSWSNTYSSGQDLTDHDFFVLTVEPDDGDPAPADHILEGTMSLGSMMKK